MQIDLTREILDKHGNKVTAKIKVPHVKELEDGEIVEEMRFKAVTLTLGHAFRDAVLTSAFTLEFDEKMKRYRLFKKIEQDVVIELSDDEVDDLIKYVNDRYEILFVGQIVDMIEYVKKEKEDNAQE